ncbi:MAG: hypothetical protein SPE78_08660, partial [Actinobacillus minor]|nr:hypothetical protein [Actinobacillus minor]
ILLEKDKKSAVGFCEVFAVCKFLSKSHRLPYFLRKQKLRAIPLRLLLRLLQFQDKYRHIIQGK